MVKPGQKYILTIIIAALVAAMSFSRHASHKNTLSIRFNNYVGSVPLQLDSAIYSNAFGQTFNVSMFKFYIGRVQLKANNGYVYRSPAYYLINEEDPGSKTVTLDDIPDGTYTSIEYILGVDSVHNCSGVQSGSLDPAQGMFWAWNTGYIFLKLEGHSPYSTASGHTIEYHIGGYMSNNNCIRNISLPMHLEISDSHTLLNIKTDISQILGSKTKVDFIKLPSVTNFHNATTIADNYADMFSILP